LKKFLNHNIFEMVAKMDVKKEKMMKNISRDDIIFTLV